MSTRPVYIILRNDDPCALSNVAHERRVLTLFERYDVPQVAAVVPRVVSDPHNDRAGEYVPLHRNAEMLSLLREYQAKDGLLEIAQHGDTHQTNRFRPSDNYDLASRDAFAGIANPWLPFAPRHPEGYSEFNGLPLAEQQGKIQHGKAYLEELFETKLETFIFPWNTFNTDCLRLLQKAGFRYVLGGNDDPKANGLLVLEGCYWWVLGEDEFTPLVEHALSQPESSLLHFSFHSWMLKEDDLTLLEAFLARFAQHEEVIFITPCQIPTIPYPVRRYVVLRRWVRKLAKRVSGKLRVPERPEAFYYPFNTRYYFKCLHFHGIAFVIFATLGLTGWFAMSGLLAAISAYGLTQTYSEHGQMSVLLALVLVFALYLFARTRKLRSLRLQQHRSERAG